jgi:mono/diheme cytochrome c family protein
MWRLILIAAVLSMLAAASARVANAADLEDGSKVVARRCAQCHGATGMGDGKALQELNIPVKPKPWTDKALMANFSDDQLTQIITQGGKAVGKSGSMPKFKNKLSNEQIADVVAYVRSLAH